MNYYKKNRQLFSKINYLNLILVLFFVSSCSAPEKQTSDTLINTNHLDHLYKEININNHTLGTIWIYSNQPDYEWVTDEDEGFTCVDDVARALVFYCREYKINPDSENLKKIKTLTNFIIHMKAENGYFFNFIFPDNSINTTHKNSLAEPNFWSWRALWALTELHLIDNTELLELKTETEPLINNLLNNIENDFASISDTAIYDGIELPAIVSVHGADRIGLIMIGLTNYYRLNKSESIKNLLIKLGNYLLLSQLGDENTFPYYAFLSWKNHWHAWGNSQAYALLHTGRTIENSEFIEAGLNEVKYFYPYIIKENYMSSFRLVKENDSLTMHDYQKFSQIAYGIRPMVFASIEAFNITKDEVYAVRAADLAKWFFGKNPASHKMYNPATGITFDGINSDSIVNYNSGAESTIEALLSIQAIETNATAKQIIQNFSENEN